MSRPTLHDWLRQEPYCLSLSSGFFSFFAHAGMLMALDAEGVPPARLTGASAGALVAGLYAAGVDCQTIHDELLRLRREDFWDPAPGLGLLRGRRFRDRLRAILPVASFTDCRLPVAVSAYDLLGRKSTVLGKGDLASALHASCAFPMLFQPVWRNGRLYSDGGIADRPGLLGAKDEPRVFYHHIASRSPWRRRNSPALRLPERTGLLSLRILELPRVGPSRLERGRAALELAHEATRRALGQAVDGCVIEVKA